MPGVLGSQAWLSSRDGCELNYEGDICLGVGPFVLILPTFISEHFGMIFSQRITCIVHLWSLTIRNGWLCGISNSLRQELLFYFLFFLHCGHFSSEAGALVAHIVSRLGFINGYSGDEHDYIDCSCLFVHAVVFCTPKINMLSEYFWARIFMS